MSVWTAPVTWSNSAVTAATMNTEVRDHLNFLKGFGDLITNSTTADTGSATYLNIARTLATDISFRTKLAADTQPRFTILADGKAEWYSGASATSVLRMSNSANAVLDISTPADGSVQIYGGLTLAADNHGAGTSGRFIQFIERVDTGVANANAGLLYARDNGAGKTQLVIRFNTGAIQVIATEP